MGTTMPATITFAQVWTVMGPEVFLVLAGFFLLVLDLFLNKEQKFWLPYLGVISLIVATWMVAKQLGGFAQLSNYMIVVDDFGNMFKLIFLIGTILVLLLSVQTIQKARIAPGEYTYLLLFATVGSMIMASSVDLIMLFVGLELLSLASYVLVAMRRGYAKSAEGAMKYLVIGAVSTAFTLYGMSFIYGITGTTNLAEINSLVSQSWATYKMLFMLAFLFLTAGFGIKLAIVPFHMWAPDTYEGAPTPITAYLAAVSKAAGFAMLLRVFIFIYFRQVADWYMILVVLGILTMIIGNVAAVTQRNMKRMLAYSSVAQAGYLLIPITTLATMQGDFHLWSIFSQTTFYLAIYTLMTIGAFAVLAVVTRESGNETLQAFQGLYKRSPWMALSMTVFLLSMAGMPITAGFFGKIYIFFGAMQAGHAESIFYWLGAIMFITSVIAFYYYFGLMRAMFTTPVKIPGQSTTTSQYATASTTHWSEQVVVAVSLVGTLVLGFFPGLLTTFLAHLHWFGQG